MSQAMGQTAPRSLVTLWTPNLEHLPICGPCDHSDLIDKCPRPVVALLLVLLCESDFKGQEAPPHLNHWLKHADLCLVSLLMDLARGGLFQRL